MYGVDFDKLSGTSKLFLDYINCRQSTCRYFGYNYSDLSAYRAVAEQIDRKKYEREKLASIISTAASHFYISDKTRENIEKLKHPNSLCVFAGQQVGLLLGPNYTALKALTAYKLSARLERELGRPVIPCFWAASDDHDFNEIKSVTLLNRDGDCRTIAYEPEIARPGAPMSDIFFDGNIDSFLAQADDAMIPTEFSSEIKSLIRESYRAGISSSNAFIDLLDRILGNFGIVPVDPNFPGMKALFAPIFRSEIKNHRKIFEIFESRSKEIIADGYHRQVHKSSNSLNLFITDGRRRNITFDGEKYMLDGETRQFTEGSLLERLDTDASSFSANVTLRPITQNHAFPTVAQIVGPSEAAYFAQIRPLFDFHDVPWPVIRPRLFATLIEPHISKIIKKLKIDFAGLVNDIEYEAGRVIRDNYPAEFQERADALRSKIDEPLSKLAEEIKYSDPESFQAIDHTRRRIDHEMNHLSKKMFMAHKKKHDDAKKRIFKAAAFLLPCGKFQERVLSPIYFVNKFGPDIFNRIEPKLDLDFATHQLVEIDS
jgi:bacillithiol biosynthesis cysteine-adding enzyme BshC